MTKNIGIDMDYLKTFTVDWEGNQMSIFKAKNKNK